MAFTLITRDPREVDTTVVEERFGDRATYEVKDGALVVNDGEGTLRTYGPGSWYYVETDAPARGMIPFHS